MLRVSAEDTPIDADRLRTGERRAHPRRRVDLRADLRVGRERRRCIVRDLSEGGAFLFWPEERIELDPAARCRVDCVLPKPVGLPVRLEGEVVRQGKEGFGMRLLNVSAPNMDRLKAFLRQGAGDRSALGRQSDQSPTQLTVEARNILRHTLQQRLPPMIDELQEAMLDGLWQASDNASSDAERTAMMGDVAMLSQAVRERWLLEPMRRELLASLKTDGDESLGSRQDEGERILELVDNERFEVWLASEALANRLEQQLSGPLGQVHRLARSAFGPGVQLPVDPQRIASALETVLSELDLSDLSVALCLREASSGLADDLRDLYADLTSAWQSAGLVAASVDPPSGPGQAIETRGETGKGLQTKLPPEAEAQAPIPRISSQTSGEALADWLIALRPNGVSETGIAPELKQRLMEQIAAGPRPVSGNNARLSERVDMADRILAQMLRDSQAPPGVKQLIKQLSTKFLALALRDAGFFRDASHPLIGIIDQLEHLSVLAPESDQLRRLVETTAATDVRDLEQLRSISSDIGVLLERHGGSVQRSAGRLIAKLEGKERLREARRQVRQRLNRTFAGRTMHKAVVRLIDEGWRTLLELVALRDGCESPAWTRYWQTLSGLHAATGGERSEGSDPPLQAGELGASLRSGLEYIGINPFHRGKLLEMANAAMDAFHARKLAQEDLIECAEIPPGPDRKPLGRQRPQGVSAKEWGRTLERIDRLAIGSRLDLDGDGGKIERRLVWRSGDGAELVFTDGGGENAHGLSRDQMAALLSQGRATIQHPSELGITGRAVDATLDQIHESIVHRQQLDPLTGLSTRNQIIGELARFSSGEPDASSESAAFGCLSPDHFEEMIGNSGYAAGDELLRTIAERLRNFLPQAACIAYMGGSRFGFLVPAPDSPSARAAGEDLRSALAGSPFIWNGKSYPVATSLGVTLVSTADVNPETLLAAADTACTAARRAGGDRVILFHEADEAIARQRAAVEGWIKAEEVVRSKRVRLRCQTIAATDPAEKQPHHHEILLSVFDEAGEVLPLMDFINSAEAFNRMAEVDRLVVEKAFSWVEENPELAVRLGGIAINLSGQSLGDERILEQIRGTLGRLPIDPNKIGFEVTETAAIGNLDQAVAIIEGIRAMGCRFALDDFGTGLSSYGYLKRLPVDYVKIDGSFVREILSSPTDEAIVKSINEIAHFMGIKTIAEFVCEQGIRERLLEIGVDYVQGYAVAKPVYLDEIELSDS